MPVAADAELLRLPIAMMEFQRPKAAVVPASDTRTARLSHQNGLNGASTLHHTLYVAARAAERATVVAEVLRTVKGAVADHRVFPRVPRGRILSQRAHPGCLEAVPLEQLASRRRMDAKYFSDFGERVGPGK